MENEKIMQEKQGAEEVSVPRKKRNKKMPLWKKIFWIIVIIIIALVIVQIVNAAKYKMVVNVVDGEDVMGINPLADKLDFGDLSRNVGMTRYVTLQSGGRVPVYIAAFKFGEISHLVEIDKNFFILEPSQEVKLAYNINILPSAETKQYNGWAVIFRLPKIF